MTPRDLIERLCILQQEVCEEVLGSSEPNDCFCGGSGFWRKGQWPDPKMTLDDGLVVGEWRSRAGAVTFIEEAVRAQIAVIKKAREAERQQIAERVKAALGST